MDDTIGVFVDPRLAKLYQEMVDEGMSSVIDVPSTSAPRSRRSIWFDIQSAIDRAEAPAIIALYESLLCGSRNHLRAFTAELVPGNPTSRSSSTPRRWRR